jgi:hypothetical protein
MVAQSANVLQEYFKSYFEGSRKLREPTQANSVWFSQFTSGSQRSFRRPRYCEPAYCSEKHLRPVNEQLIFQMGHSDGLTEAAEPESLPCLFAKFSEDLSRCLLDNCMQNDQNRSRVCPSSIRRPDCDWVIKVGNAEVGVVLMSARL